MAYSTSIDAEDLMDGDVFESHDDLTHEVVSVDYTDASPLGEVVVSVRKSDGSTYTAQFPRHAVVSIREG